MQTCTFFISRPCLSPTPRLSTPATFPGTLPRAKERRTVAFLAALRAAALFEYLRRCTRSCLLEIEQQKNALHFRVRHSLVHHQWARQEFSPVRLSACKASILLRKTARAVVRRARRTLFAPRFRSRSIVAPAHKPATIFSDQSPRDEHERLREVRVRPEGNGATKKPQHSLWLFLVHHQWAR